MHSLCVQTARPGKEGYRPRCLSPQKTLSIDVPCTPYNGPFRMSEPNIMLPPSLFESVFSNSSTSNCLLTPTPDAIILAVNDAFLKAASRIRHDLLGKSLFEVFPANPDDEEDTGEWSLRNSLARVIATGEPETMPVQRYHIRVVLPNGEVGFEERFWSVGNTPIFGEDGKLLCISHITTDITDQIRAQMAKRESEDRFRLMADAVPQIVWITDSEGRVEFFNQHWSDYTGLTYEPETAAEVAAAVVHADDIAVTMERFDQARRDGVTFLVEHRIKSASGHYRWFLVKGEPYRDPCTGQITRWFGASVDIHDRKQTEQAFRETADRLEFTLDAAKIGEWYLDLVNDDAHRSLRHDQCFGYNELLPEWGFETFIQHVHPEDREQVEKRFEEALAELKDWHFDCRVIWPDGSVHWIAAHGTIYHNDAKATKMSGIVLDVTEQRQVEEALRQEGKRKDEFLAMLAHELRNPLAPISAAAQLLQIARLDEARVHHTSQIIGRQVRHMTHLIDDLLDVSRVTRGLVELENAPVDIRHIITDAVEQVTPLIQSRRHHLALLLPPDTTMVMGDKKRLVQVLANVLNNAAKYTNEGGNLLLKTDVHEAYLLIEVSDNGIGMTPELVAHAFDLFAQAERSSDRSSGGLGLGLALVKSLVELHGGTASCESEGVGKGSKFTIKLPRITESIKQTPHHPEQRLANTLQSLRILVVDDNEDAAAMLAFLLEATGHEVLVEHTSKQALERARIEKPDVCLLDIGLPEMDGNELARCLRSQPETANAVLIAITGYGQSEDRKNSSAAGFDHHLVKPVDTEKLVSLLAGVSKG